MIGNDAKACQFFNAQNLSKTSFRHFLRPSLTFFFIMMLALLAGIACGKEEEDAENKLSSALFQLATSEDPQGFAKRHGISLVDGSVKVIIFSTGDFNDIAKRYDLKEVKKYGDGIKAVVPIKNLIPLSREQGVRYIRRPHKFWGW